MRKVKKKVTRANQKSASLLLIHVLGRLLTSVMVADMSTMTDTSLACLAGRQASLQLWSDMQLD